MLALLIAALATQGLGGRATLEAVGSLPESLRWLFPEVDFANLDTAADHVDYILARVLERGRLQDVKWVIAAFGMERIHQFFRDVGHPEISERTRCFWRAVFRAEDERWRLPPAWRLGSSVPWIA